MIVAKRLGRIDNLVGSFGGIFSPCSYCADMMTSCFLDYSLYF